MLTAMFCAFCAPLVAGERSGSLYGEMGLGLAGGGKATGPAIYLRGVRETKKHDFSFGYLNLYGMKAESMKSSGAALPTLLFEVARVFKAQAGGEISLGGGIGYTMPNLSSGVNEQADNDISYTAVGAFKKALGPKADLVISVRGFFFSTDSQLTTYGSHMETLSTGQAVEVLDEFHHDDRMNFNSVIFMASVRWG